MRLDFYRCPSMVVTGVSIKLPLLFQRPQKGGLVKRWLSEKWSADFG